MWPGEAFYLPDPCELTFANTLLLSNAAISLGNAFINLEISSQYIIFFTLWSFYLSSLFISLQIKEFRILAYSINDSLYSCLFFFLTALHFFHLILGILLLFLIFFLGSFRSVLLSYSVIMKWREEWKHETKRKNWNPLLASFLPFSPFPSFSFVFHSIKRQHEENILIELKQRKGKGIRNKVDRVLANHSLSSTASQGTSNIPLSSHPSSNLTARHGLLGFVLIKGLFYRIIAVENIMCRIWIFSIELN